MCACISVHLHLSLMQAEPAVAAGTAYDGAPGTITSESPDAAGRWEAGGVFCEFLNKRISIYLFLKQ